MKLFWKLYHFFRVWRRDYYGQPIGVSFAWSLACAFADVNDEWSNWRELQ